mmetsp:Transcript_43661/g.127054  ORF Transcript_43661/g.127054 Transcript_43661/m.127054 type:complete len:471 (-) Transcript_43661:216-1628(-)
MPMLLGTLRRNASQAPENLKEAPGESLSTRRTELAAFDSLLEAVQTFNEEILAASTKFAAAPDALMKQLEETCSEAPSLWRQIVTQLAAQLDKTSDRLKSGARHVQAVQYLLEQSRAQSKEVHDAFKTRDAAWVPKARCDQRAGELRKRFGPNLLLAEKKARLQAKHQADLEFQRCTEEATKAVDGLLDRRWAITGAMMWEICRHYMAVFQEADKIFVGFSAVANSLVPPPSTESQLVPADSVIASFNGLPGVTEWLEKARSAAAEVVSCEGRDALQLPPRRRPATPPPAPALKHLGVVASMPALGADGVSSASSSSSSPQPAAAAPAPLAATAPSRLEGGLGPILGALMPSSARTVETASPPALASALAAAAATSDGGPALQPQTTTTITQGQSVQVWSVSSQTWLNAVVESVFDRPQIAHGYWAPAGAVKVSHANGTKYIRPEHIGETLRHLPAGSPSAPQASGCIQN